jgi:hypothetical protein
MEINRRGANRFVILTRRYAFKFPNILGGWFQACWGMIDNMQERRAQGQQGICPLLWSLPGGLLNVMPRARELTPRSGWRSTTTGMCSAARTAQSASPTASASSTARSSPSTTATDHTERHRKWRLKPAYARAIAPEARRA